jgi:hypothetical protein
MDESTTDAATQDTGADYAQPEELQAEAVTTDSESIETTDQNDAGETAEEVTTSSDDPADFWAKKGIDISTPEGQAKAAKSYAEAEKAMHNKAQQASELSKQINQQPLSVDTDNELVRQALEKSSQLETTLAVQSWKASNNITPEQDQALGQYVQSNPDKAYLLKNGFLSLDDIYKMSGVGTVDPTAARKQGEQEALANLANKQRATSPAGNAVNSAPPASLTRANVEQWWDSLGSEGRKDPANRAKLDALL